MSIPDYQTLMLPLLKLAADRKEHSFREAVEKLSKQFRLTEREKQARLKTGLHTVMTNRVAWARTYLKKAGLIESSRRGYFSITQRGVTVLRENPARVDDAYLGRFSEFASFRTPRPSKKPKTKTLIR